MMNDNYMVSCGEDNLMKMWDRRANKELKSQSFDQHINGIYFFRSLFAVLNLEQ